MHTSLKNVSVSLRCDTSSTFIFCPLGNIHIWWHHLLPPVLSSQKKKKKIMLCVTPSKPTKTQNCVVCLGMHVLSRRATNSTGEFYQHLDKNQWGYHTWANHIQTAFLFYTCASLSHSHTHTAANRSNHSTPGKSS